MRSIELPWGAWHGDGRHAIPVPDGWIVDYLSPDVGKDATKQEVALALDHPIASEPLSLIASRARSVCIVTDDIARPTPLVPLLSFVTARLHAAGVASTAVRIVIATGAHRALTRRELELKLGVDTCSEFRVESHSLERLAPTGIRYGDAELLVNATYLDADLKILIGSPLPHAFAGSSGGAKLVIPGLASLDATLRSHKFILMGLRSGGDPTRSTFRNHIEELVGRLGVHFAISVVTNANRKVVAVFAGDLVESHRAASTYADTLYNTPVHGDYDCLILNAYPKDTDLIQSETAFVAFKRASLPVVPNGLVVLTTAASEGIGQHGLFEPGGAAYRQPVLPRALRGRELWLYAPSMSTADAHRLFPEQCSVFQRPDALANALQDRFAGPVSCGVLPAAPMQLINSSSAGR